MERLERIQIKILDTPLENLRKIRCTRVHLSQTELMVSENTYLCVGVGKKPGPLPVASQHLRGHFSQRTPSSIQYPFTKIIPVEWAKIYHDQSLQPQFTLWPLSAKHIISAMWHQCIGRQKHNVCYLSHLDVITDFWSFLELEWFAIQNHPILL